MLFDSLKFQVYVLCSVILFVVVSISLPGLYSNEGPRTAMAGQGQEALVCQL